MRSINIIIILVMVWLQARTAVNSTPIMQAAMQFSRLRHIQIRTENLNLEYHSEYQSEKPENQTHSTVKVIWWSFPSHYLNPYSTSYNFLRAGLRKTASNKFKVHVTKKTCQFHLNSIADFLSMKEFFKWYDHGISRIRLERYIGCLFI